MTDLIVTQEDREAAADLMVLLFTGAPDLEGDLGWAQVVRACEDDGYPIVQAFASHRIKAALAMQERAAKVCEEQQQAFFSPEYATGQPLSSITERFACGQCADAIRNLEVPE